MFRFELKNSREKNSFCCILSSLVSCSFVAAVCFSSEQLAIAKERAHARARAVSRNRARARVRAFLIVDFASQLKAGNTKGGSITVPLTSCLTGLD
jgi:hypothetical protein